MLHFPTNNGIYIISFAHFQCFLALFDLNYLIIPAFTMFSFFKDLGAELALIGEKLHQTNSTGIFIQLFLNIYNLWNANKNNYRKKEK